MPAFHKRTAAKPPIYQKQTQQKKKVLTEREEKEKDPKKSKVMGRVRGKGGTEEAPGKRGARRQDINSARAQTGSGHQEGREAENNFGSADLFMFSKLEGSGMQPNQGQQLSASVTGHLGEPEAAAETQVNVTRA